MSVPPIATFENSDAAEICHYLDRLAATERFRKAPSLRHLLEYLVRMTVEGRAGVIKESVIAMDVFGRPQDLESGLGNIVRVQAHRLRKLLDAHYADDGVGDEFHIVIPKGSYVPRIIRMGEIHAASCDPSARASVVEAQVHSSGFAIPQIVWRRSPRGLRSVPFVATFAAGALCVFAVLWSTGHISGMAPLTAANPAGLHSAPLAVLWGSVLQPGVNCVVSFTNPAFLWTKGPHSRIYMTYQGPLSAPVGTEVGLSSDDPNVDAELVRRGTPFFFSDSWTGTGEVLGVNKLTRLFAEAGHPLKVIRSRALTYGDMAASNVIFLGSPWANELQDKFNAGPTPLYCVGPERIINRDPKPDEPAYYEPVFDPETRQLAASYSLFNVLPGIAGGTKMFSSAGIDTYGTLAGIDYFTSAAGVNELINRFDPARKRRLPPYFQAVIRTEIVRGEVSHPKLVLVRELDAHTFAPAGSNQSR